MNERSELYLVKQLTLLSILSFPTENKHKWLWLVVYHGLVTIENYRPPSPSYLAPLGGKLNRNYVWGKKWIEQSEIPSCFPPFPFGGRGTAAYIPACFPPLGDVWILAIVDALPRQNKKGDRGQVFFPLPPKGAGGRLNVSPKWRNARPLPSPSPKRAGRG